MEAFRSKIAQEYQARFDSIKQTMEEGGDISMFAAEDPEKQLKRDQELKE